MTYTRKPDANPRKDSAMSATTTDRAAELRAAYKAKGWSSRDISVRAEYYSMGSSIYVRIKNPRVPFAWAEAIANEHESIDRDQWGEILSGGNRYVHVSYSSDAEAIIETMYLAVLLRASQALDADASDRSLHPIGTTGFLLGRGSNGYGYSLWKDGHIQEANEPQHLATTLHARMVTR